MGLKIGQDRGQADGVWVNVSWGEATGYVWWLDHEPALSEDGEAEARLHVARANNQDSKEHARKTARKYRDLRRRRGGSLPDEMEQKLVREQYAHTVLLDWEGIALDESGEAQPYSPEAGLEAFQEDEDFFELVLDIATTNEAFRAEAVAEEAEELGNASDGRPSGADTSTNSEPKESS